MNKSLYISLTTTLLLTGCQFFKIHTEHTSYAEVGHYISDYVSEPSIDMHGQNETIILSNAASAEKIVLHLHVDESYQNNDKVTIQCMSQCGVELAGDLGKLHIKSLDLKNVHLLTNPNLTVENINITSSEAITTGLPVVTKQAKITIQPSTDMISAQKLIKAMNIIPASGEFVYDTNIVYDNKGKALNSHNDGGIADAVYSLNSLKKTCPNLKWAAPVVSWFGISQNGSKDTDVSKLEIVPAVDSKQDIFSETWKIGNTNRQSAYLISRDNNGRPNYGGSINDGSLLRYIELLKNKNLKVMFYPVILMDIEGKPWRGRIKATNPDNVHEFFYKKNGYNNFILHYAELLKGKVDAFVIGSELQDLTQSVDNRYEYPNPKRYPAVVELIDLSKKVREILGPNAIITYAANWSEYHHDKAQIHHLDILWSSPSIDVVGIDAYLPITNKSWGDISVNDIKTGWANGELWHYYYDRNKKADLMPEWGLKQIEYWWSNEHWSKGIKSSWVPKMKPIWFTEFGFPSMHMATNKPNAYWQPKSTSEDLPKHSSGKPDFSIQARAIRGTLEYWEPKHEIVQNMFLWAWDARPFPYYPNRLDIWSDGDMWSRGHWINGKLEPFSQVRLLPGVKVNAIEVHAETFFTVGPDNEIGQITTKHHTNI